MFRNSLKLGACAIVALFCALSANSAPPLTNLFSKSILSCGAAHLLMVKSDGTLWVAGLKGTARLGGADYLKGYYVSNSSGVFTLPAPITNFSGVTEAAAGTYHSLALKYDGSVWSFGANDKGELGLGDTVTRHSPVKIPTLSSVAHITAGDRFSMAIMSNGFVKAWGENLSGQLGIGTTTGVGTPTEVLNLSNVVAVSCGESHSLAVSEGKVWAWGNNGSGQLGDGTRNSRSAPIRINSLGEVVAVAAGSRFSLALRTNGNVYVWGESDSARLGLGADQQTDVLGPLIIPGLSNIVQIQAGSRQGYALDRNGKVWVWGFNGDLDRENSWALGFSINGMVYEPETSAKLANVCFLGSTGPKNESLDIKPFPSHVSAALYADDTLRIWGAFLSYDSSQGFSHLGYLNTPNILTANVAWGYRNDVPIGRSAPPLAFKRGTGTLADFCSFVLPIDFQQGIALSGIGGSATNLFPFLTNSPVAYHFDATNSDLFGQTNLNLRIAYQNPLAAFGPSADCPLFTERSYRFIVYGGAPSAGSAYPDIELCPTALRIEVYSRTNFAFVAATNIPVAHRFLTNGSWSDYLTNGLMSSIEAFGLKTMVTQDSASPNYGVTNTGLLRVTHIADIQATNYTYVLSLRGHNGKGWVSLGQDLSPIWQPLYTLQFEPAAPWNIRFLSQIHFDKEPLPPFYDGKSLTELMTNSCVVTNTIDVTNTSDYLSLDHSPELLSHPILDELVSNLKNEPLAIARFVQNEIALTDALDYKAEDQIRSARLLSCGINRSALGTLLERQGSPTEQCALLIYMLRRAGVPALYAFPPDGGVTMLDRRLSKMLRFQVADAISPITYTTNSNVAVALNYPWVAAHIDGNWVHLFPWIKDVEIVQGPNVYDFLPEKSHVMQWVTDYLYNRPSVMSLGEPQDTPEELFPRYISQELAKYAPGMSLDDFGMRCTTRKVSYNTFAEFPRPTWVSSTNLIAESLSDPFLATLEFQSWNSKILPSTNFNTVQIKVKEGEDEIINTGKLRACDLHNRVLLFYHRKTNESAKAILYLAPFRPDITGQEKFTNSSQLKAEQFVSRVLKTSTRNLSLSVTLNRYHPGWTNGSDEISRTMNVAKGDLNAICLNYGRVTREMLEPTARQLWNMERQIKEDPSITNNMAFKDYQGPLMYLMGMAYYEKLARFDPFNERIHFRSPVATLAIGLSKLIAQKSDEPEGLPDGAIKFVQPCVDMATYLRASLESPLSRPDSGEQLGNHGEDSYNILSIVDGSAKEHEIINSFFKETEAISTVRLLQITQERHATNSSYKEIGLLNSENALPYRNGYFKPRWDANNETWDYSCAGDTNIWNTVERVLFASPYSQAFVTPGSVSNYTGSYNGTGALIIDSRGIYYALISGAGNGGWGTRIPGYSFDSSNLRNVSLGVNWSGNYSISYTAPSQSYRPAMVDCFAPSRAFDLYQSANNGFLSLNSFNTQFASQVGVFLGVMPTPDQNNFFARTIYTSESRACLGFQSDALMQFFSKVSDPVHAVTGEFYEDVIDLSLAGPLPLDIRRNYSSLNLADNQFGIGWKFGFTPYMSVSTNDPVMYAAEPDGSVLAYERASTNINVYVPTLIRNPQFVNNRTDGVGSTVNLLLSRIEVVSNAGSTNYILYSPNGSVRTYTQREFPINGIDRSRPYLQRWVDAQGNYLTFNFGTNITEPDYGELNRIDSSNGGYVHFRYDVYGHIVEAFSGDGRHVHYRYDDFGDLVSVLAPDNSETLYEYDHSTQSVTNKSKVTQEPYSLHQLARREKPDGRVLLNVYDSQRRVVTQASTVGTDLTLVTNATFTYVNDFVLTNSFTNTISGTTEITDAFGKISRYEYTNSCITRITDPLLQTIEQTWYPDNSVPPGYSRSLWKAKDKRGLLTEFQYDERGNLTNIINTGAITGLVGDETAIQSVRYNTNNLPIAFVNEIGNSNVVSYDSSFQFLPAQTVSYRQGTPISTNKLVYGSETNIVTYGSATWTNLACGLLRKQIQAFGSPDAATNEWFYDGRGFITAQIQYTSSGSPAITNLLSHNNRGELFERTDPAGNRLRFDYDMMGRLKSEEVFAPGQLQPMFWNYSYYNANGEMTWADGPRYDPEDYVWADYDGDGRKTVEVRWRTRAKADGTGVEEPPTDDLYSITSFEYDAFGNQTKVVDPLGNYKLMAYDPVCQLTQTVSYAANGTALATNRMSYEAGGKIAAETNALGGWTQTFYTQTGLPVHRVNADGSTNSWVYHLDGRVWKEFAANGAYWETVYDDANLRTLRLFKDAGGALLASTTNIFDRRGNVITNISAEGRVLFATYDALNRVKSKGSLDRIGGTNHNVVYTDYDSTGFASTNLNALGGRTVTVSDPLMRPVWKELRDTVTDKLLSITLTTYHPNHHGSTTTSGWGQDAISQTSFTDTMGHTVLEQQFPSDELMDYKSFVYDAAGNLQQAQDELGHITAYTYDGLNRLQTRRLPDNALISYHYNAEGGLVSMTMPNSMTWSATYSKAGQRTGEKLVNSQVTRQFTNVFHNFGPFAGLLARTIDLGRSVTNTFDYDPFLRLATDSAVGVLPEHTLHTSYSYDNDGVVTNQVQTSALNPATRVSHAYNRYAELTNEVVYLGGVPTSSMRQEWNAAGIRSALISPTAWYDYSYRPDGSMGRVTAFGASYAFDYDTAGLLASRSNSWRAVSVTQRDGNGRVTVQTTTAGGSTPLYEAFAWRANSTLDSYNAVRSGTGAWNDNREFAYNSRGQLTAANFNLLHGTLVTASYGFDAAKLGVHTSTILSGSFANSWAAGSGSPDGFGRITSEMHPNALVHASGIAYGATSVSGTLDGSQVGNISYNPADHSGRWSADLSLGAGQHILTMKATHPSGLYASTNSSNFRVESACGPVTTSYDNAGYVVSRSWSNCTQTLKWDADGRLIRVSQRDNQNNGYEWGAVYDALSRRLRTTHTNVVAGVLSSGGTVVDSIYDPEVEFEEICVAVNGARTWKIMGPDQDGSYGGMQGLGGLEATVRENGLQVEPVISDYFGNILASVSNGQVIWSSNRVDGYGALPGYPMQPLSDSVSLAEASVWRGKRMDPTGFYYLGARHYEPVSGRFLSPDPAGHEGSFDLYSFANGDPVNFFDPDGRFVAGFANGAMQWGSRSYASFGNIVDAVARPVVGMASDRLALNFQGGHTENPIYARNYEEGSQWYRAGHEVGYVAAEIGFQVAVAVATEGMGRIATAAASAGRGGAGMFANVAPMGGTMALGQGAPPYAMGVSGMKLGNLNSIPRSLAPSPPSIPSLGSSSLSTQLRLSSSAQVSPILQTQKQLSQLVNRQGAVVDRWLASSRNRWAKMYRANQASNPNFAKGIRGRILDARMRRKFDHMFGNVPGIRIDRTIPGSGNRLRPDVYFPNLGGRRIIFDVGGLTKVDAIFKYEQMADDLIPLIPEQWIP